MHFQSCLMSVLAAGSAMAHMYLKDPISLENKDNPNTLPAHIDYTPTAPITQAQYPCKGYTSLLGTSEAASVKTYAPGQQASLSIGGTASHNGGSCQLSLSYDKGKTFTVIKSWIGNCPTASGGTFDFTIPSDAPEADEVVFAWTWVNKSGNREYYMSCAVVSIKGTSKREVSDIPKRATVAFAGRPQVFQANLGGEYCTKEGVDTVFPNPGPDVENTSTTPGPPTLCATGADAPVGDAGSSGSGSGSGSSSGSGSASGSSSAAQEPEPSTTASAAGTTASLGGVFLTTNLGGTPTTLATATSVAAVPTTPVAVPTSSAAAGGSATASASAPANSGAVQGQQTGPCTQEGAWSCIDGANFQRCASGQWSAVIAMAAGTKCTVGVSDNLQMGRRRDRVNRRSAGAWGW